MTDWTQAMIDRLHMLHTEGLSAAQIAADLRVTRNAVIGKRARLGLREPEDRVAAREISARQRARREAEARVRAQAAREAAARRRAEEAEARALASAQAAAVAPAPPPSADSVTLFDRGQGQCSWRMWDNEERPVPERAFVCGAPVNAINQGPLRQPYCPDHRQISYSTAALRRQAA